MERIKENMKVIVDKELASLKDSISAFLGWCKMLKVIPSAKALDLYMATLSLSMEPMYEVQNQMCE